MGIDFGCFKGEYRFENLRTTSREYVNKVANYAESMDGEDQSWSVSEAIAILKNAMKEKTSLVARSSFDDHQCIGYK